MGIARFTGREGQDCCQKAAQALPNRGSSRAGSPPASRALTVCQRDLSKRTRLTTSLLAPMLSGVPAYLCSKSLGTQHPSQLGFSVAAPVHLLFPPLSSLPAFAQASAEPESLALATILSKLC